jgi:hypothetical protein
MLDFCTSHPSPPDIDLHNFIDEGRIVFFGQSDAPTMALLPYPILVKNEKAHLSRDGPS